MDNSDSEIYPTIEKLLRFLASLPESAATAKQSVSTLRHLKSLGQYGRGKTDRIGTTKRPLGHSKIDLESIIVRFAKKKRGEEFVLKMLVGAPQLYSTQKSDLNTVYELLRFSLLIFSFFIISTSMDKWKRGLSICNFAYVQTL